MPVYIVHLSAREALDEVRDARDRGVDGLRRDLPAVPVPLARRPRQRVRGRQVRVLAAAPAEGPLGRALERASSRTTSRSSRPTTARSTSRARRSSAGATSARSPTACPASRTGSTCSTTAASSAAGSPGSAGSRSSRPRRPSCSGCTRARASVGVGADADLVVYDPNRDAHDLGRRPTTWTSTTRATRAARSRAASDVVLSRGSVIVRDGAVHRPQGPRHVRQALARRLRPAGLRPRDHDAPDAPHPCRARPRWPRSRELVRDVAVDARRPGVCIDDLVQAVDEAATNVIVHGYDGAPGLDRGQPSSVDGDELVDHARGRRARRSTRRSCPEPDLTRPARASPARRDGHPPDAPGDGLD